MSKYIKINEELNIKQNKQIKEYLNPDYIYIPYPENSILNIKNNEEIFKNSVILENNQQKIYSPISGTVIGLCENIVDNKKIKTIVIENNFKESLKKITPYQKDFNKITKEELKEKLNLLNIYKDNLDGKIMIVNGMDYEPYEETISYLIKEHTEQILESIDALINILKLDKCYLAIKDNDSANVQTLLNNVGTYPNIELKLLPDIYPIGYKDLLIKELASLDENVIYFTAEDIYNIYNALKKNLSISEKLITVSGNLLNKSKVMNVKIGTRLADIIENEFKILSDDYHIIINGLLSGYEINSLNTIITSNVRSIFINSLDKSEERKCINCGLCHINCPVKANPRFNKNMDKCLKCGLCNYLCPSKIKLVGEKS
jgi:electron transport complex protein RnfC